MTSTPSLTDARNLATRLRRQATTADATRAELHAMIDALLAAGERQVDVAAATGYSRERLRQLAHKK